MEGKDEDYMSDSFAYFFITRDDSKKICVVARREG